jgi:pyridoxal phosphate enzyme (YggS family)
VLFMYAERLQHALPEVRARIEQACQRAARPAAAVTIVAVTKGHPPEALRAAREIGLSVIGESRVQEARAKREAVGDLGLEWHLVGHLQRNKVSQALRMFGLIHSLDSLRLARAIDVEATRLGRRVPVLVQVNASGERTKQGLSLSDSVAVLREICALNGLRVLGLMTMAPLTSERAVLRETFGRTRELFERCRDSVPGFEARHLSMGMTNDYEVAVEAGSTMVRLGTVLFGERHDD